MLAFQWPKNHETRGLQQNFCVNLLRNMLNKMHPYNRGCDNCSFIAWKALKTVKYYRLNSCTII